MRSVVQQFRKISCKNFHALLKYQKSDGGYFFENITIRTFEKVRTEACID